MTEPNKLTTVARCIEEAFDEDSRPSLRSFRGWQAKGWIPYRKIGKRTYFDPAEVRAAIDRRFTVQAKTVETVEPSTHNDGETSTTSTNSTGR
jgi:hypothetical protein